MYDFLPSSSIPFSLSKIPTPNKPIPQPFPNFSINGTSFLFLRLVETTNKKKNPSVLGSGDHGFRAELGFKEKRGEDPFFDNYDTIGSQAKWKETKKNNGGGSREGVEGEGEANSSEVVMESKNQNGSGGERNGRFEDDKENLVRFEDDEEEKLVRDNGGRMVEVRKGRKQIMRRSSLLAKQVISIRSALSLGFVSQLWVDTTSWIVLFLEVRPNLLSGECERFLLEDVSQVGDVVLVEDETVIENEFKMIGLETLACAGSKIEVDEFSPSANILVHIIQLKHVFSLPVMFLLFSLELGMVGYKVVTPGRRNVGKVRGYTFNINSGAIESLELDSFGISIIPSSLVSTYALLVEDVLEVLADAVVIHEAAASRIQRLTKNVGTNIDDLEEYANFERPLRSEQSRKSSGTRKFHRMNREIEDDWELPMDYL